MIIDVNDIRAFRQIAANIDDSRVEIYIREAQVLDVMPAIGAALMQRFEDARAERTELTPEEQMMLEGGSWTTDCGDQRHFEGIRTALCYFAYARFVRNHQTQVTPYGVVTKEADDSSPASHQTVAAVASDALKIAQEHLREALDYWHAGGADCICGGHKIHGRRHIIAIGD